MPEIRSYLETAVPIQLKRLVLHNPDDTLEETVCSEKMPHDWLCLKADFDWNIHIDLG